MAYKLTNNSAGALFFNRPDLGLVFYLESKTSKENISNEEYLVLQDYVKDFDLVLEPMPSKEEVEKAAANAKKAKEEAERLAAESKKKADEAAAAKKKADEEAAKKAAENKK
ncbi:hypothetical protein EVB32_353 [Rhizobium phage RHph_TM39]|uniref:Uncharacterized protein n=2 Tax=Cuauhnahuacvirus TaxID=3044696 RepID=A0A7S5UW47_9CAUD|nr:hypothetical protein PQC16_gp283 [Rhizobium phage RHph_TM30]YP_010671506.1 hypothetical protein PQC17_gp284 [Rhizobium phage RHph_Y65]QIG72189.1 hypothetical protein EVB95_376 [Rhizobium phage RHph_TM2_3B]QIG72552.1 hypothetical protein EVB96_376 [Rhizobium phage RHph_TM3_3_6]QIG77321.1 hypothetical protein EVB32_353 [Rhizobium phage RHph_TM39]QIG77581.1 hypothetical protein EVB61_275 [Rhizobium phage RHph_TM21B]QIG77936.1 hypothetical protein EVB64_370 [Rhizobium phage RHph_TM61]